MLIQKLAKRGADFLGVQTPILAGAMTWVSDSDLTAAVSNAGGFGVLAGGNIPPQSLKEEIELCFQKTQNNFAVNLITVSPYYKEQLAMVLETDVKYIILAGGIPHPDHLLAAKKSGKKVIAFAPTLKLGLRLQKLGIDALIIEGHEAGGHIGSVTTMVLIQEILFNIKDIPIFVAGGIGSGRMVAHLLLMGASGAQLGTRFVLSVESNVHPNMKEAFIKAESRDAVVSFRISKEIPVIPVRALKNHGHEEFMDLQIEVLRQIQAQEITKEAAAMAIEDFWLGALKNATQNGDIERGSLMAGTSVGLFKDILTVKEIIDRYVQEAEQTLVDIKNSL